MSNPEKKELSTFYTFLIAGMSGCLATTVI